jgi:UDP-N-acetylglucosamine/UDP-N-acetylgalactosamine diphosphorylase
MRRYDVEIPLYIMTSPATDHETRAYFAANNNCDLPEHLLNIFCQGTMPAVDDASGKVLLKSKHEISISPDGHGGLVAALAKHGCLEDAESRGIDLFYYAQVDNPMAQICEPALLGYHLLASSQMTTQVVKKRFATEKVGNVVTIDGKTQIIEYSDLPPEVAELTNEDGSLKFWAGNIAIHVFDRTFLQSVVDDAEGLPFHRAHKKVPYIDEQGNAVQPDDPNAIKFERFVFDLLPLAKNAIVVEGDPAEVFAPVKNADGGPVDTPSDTQDALLSLHRRWLTDAGAKIEEDVEIEIHPAWALDAGEVASKLEAGTQFTADTFLR